MFVATIGFFDGVHHGHRFLIDMVKEEAEREGLRSMVVTMDNHPKTVINTGNTVGEKAEAEEKKAEAEEKKAGRGEKREREPGEEKTGISSRKGCFVPELLTTTQERLELLKETGIDRVEVIHFDRQMAGMDARTFMREVLCRKLKVKVLVMGYDHKFGHGGGTHEDYVRWGEECGIKVVLATQLDGMYASSSEIRRMLREGDVAGAARLLGYNYMLSGTVEDGHKVGRTLGFPTANIRIAQDKLIPARGVYAVETDLGKGIMNIGRRPTLNNGNDVSVEVHILDYRGDLYGKDLQVRFIDRIREERTFSNTEELKEQIRKDAETALRLFAATEQNV